MLARLRDWYGAGPLHLLALLASFALAGFAAAQLVPDEPRKVLLWFVAAVIGHDLVLFPLYALADRSLTDVLRHRRPDSEPARLAVNHVRFPVLMSGLLLLVWAPLVLGLTDGYEAATGMTTDVYLGRWLAITAALFLFSAVAYAVRLRRVQE
ncbi:MAG: hypothetical protein ACR2JF_00065 [Iamia sp.]